MKRTRSNKPMETSSKEAKKEESEENDASDPSDDEAVDDDYEYNYYSDTEEYMAESCVQEDTPTYVPCDASKYIDAGDADLMTWADNHLSRLPIVSLIRQILKNPSAETSMMISRDDLFSETSVKEFHFFVRIRFPLVVLYSLTFTSDKEFGSYAPRLRCLTYCNAGTYLYPSALLPNTFSKFVDFGKIFTSLKEKLSELLPASTPSTMLKSIPATGYEVAVQDLAYLTQFHTSFLLSVSDCGIVTGLNRQVTAATSGGVGYSSGNHYSHTVITQDTAYITALIDILATIHTCLTNGSLCSSNAFDAITQSPLIELLSQLVAELSIEEAARQCEYSSSLFLLIGVVQGIVNGHPAVGVTSSFPEVMIGKIAQFKSVLGEEFNLSTIAVSASAPPMPTSPSFSSATPVIYAESFSHHVFSSPSTTKPALLRRMKIEISTLTENLPAAITVMISEEQLTQSRFLIRGPPDTPYFGGFFLFDMNLPSNYPEQPPQVNIITTGSGTARFNPNLYACGKVCLSLLGTWSGEKWNPQLSNINQVLQSILYMIFISDPYFNEPGYEASRNTPAGQRSSYQYNLQIRRYTLKHAILDHLTRPNAEFGDIVSSEIKSGWPNTRAYVVEHWAPHDNTIMDIVSKIDQEVAKA